MMLQSGDGPMIFSAETNPYLRQREGDSFSIFGKKIKKKTVTDILGKLAGKKSSAGDVSEGGAPVYDPAQLYGGVLSMYGGKKVRGGLLGE